MEELAAPQRKLLLRALSRPPRKGEGSVTVNLGFGSLEWKFIQQDGHVRDAKTGRWVEQRVTYGPYAYLRVWGKGQGDESAHHSFYLGGAVNPRTAFLEERLAAWIGGGTVGTRRSYRAADFPAGRRERPPGRKANLDTGDEE